MIAAASMELGVSFRWVVGMAAEAGVYGLDGNDALDLEQHMEASMNIRLVCSALIIGALTAVTVPQTLSAAQSDDQGASARKSATPNMNTTPRKHRYWRHSGGRHPHYGSRRVRAP